MLEISCIENLQHHHSGTSTIFLVYTAGPVALYGLMSLSILKTPFLLTTIGLKLGWMAGFSFGNIVISSTDKLPLIISV